VAGAAQSGWLWRADAPAPARPVAVNPVLAGLQAGLDTYRRTWGSLPRLTLAATLRPGDRGVEVSRLRERLGLRPLPAIYDAAVAAKVRAFRHVHGLPEGESADAATVAMLNRDPAGFAARIGRNIERARILPAAMGARWVWVDVPQQRVELVEGGRVVAWMKAVVGKAATPTPVMNGRISYLALNPYWNLPPDLIAERARTVLREGTGVLARERIEVLSGWGDDAAPIPPERVDWAGVAAGTVQVRARQLPGADNMMGAVKFMMPNDLGIYLHDTPMKVLFERPVRLFSAGCVRVSAPRALARWLLGRDLPAGDGPAGQRPEQRVDLQAPVPVYITYFTALPDAGGVRFRADPYRRDG
jgi:murein L,D-transpeptidase YcbB/YkuD